MTQRFLLILEIRWYMSAKMTFTGSNMTDHCLILKSNVCQLEILTCPSAGLSAYPVIMPYINTPRNSTRLITANILASYCLPPPDKPIGGTMKWDSGSTIFGTTIEYDAHAILLLSIKKYNNYLI